MQIIKVEFQYKTTITPPTNMYRVEFDDGCSCAIVAADELEAWQRGLDFGNSDSQNTGSR
jgi:hypothetical protein